MFRKLLILVAIILAILTIVNMTRNSPLCARSSVEQAHVVRVIDGDTIEVITQDGVKRVRYIGIDTPERGEPYSRLATVANSDLVAGKVVTMYKDKVNQDRYGRLLRYVFIDDIFVNYELVGMGLAKILTVPPNKSCRNFLLGAERRARTDQRGLWAWKQYGDDVWCAVEWQRKQDRR